MESGRPVIRSLRSLGRGGCYRGHTLLLCVILLWRPADYITRTRTRTRTPAGNTLAAAFAPDRQGQDTTMVSDASSLISRSLPRQINHTALLEFMSMMTLMQCRMDMTLTVPDTRSRPVAQTPTSRDDQTPPRRSGTPVRRSRTPVRHSRTPVRRSRGMDESRFHSFPVSH